MSLLVTGSTTLNAQQHDEDEDGPSRSQRRRAALAVLTLAEQLVSLSANQLAQIELPEDVRCEIDNVHRIHAYGARKRQMAFLAKQMRRHDESAFISAQAALGENHERRRQQHAALQRLETLRQRLLENGDEALTELIAAHPDVDRQRLRSLVRQARTERDANKPPRAYRQLFRVLRTISDDTNEN